MYSSEVQQPTPAITDTDHPQHGTYAGLNQPSRSTPVATDQKVGGSSPSERATVSSGQGHLLVSERVAFTLVTGRFSRNLSQLLDDAVNPGQRPATLPQVVVARVDVGLHVK